MSPFLTLTFNVGFFSTVILGVLGVRKAARFFASIPDLPEEERLRRMADFCAAQMTRVRDMPEGPAREKELARLEKVREDIARQRKKFEAAELRRVEWNRRIRRLDETGAPMRPERFSRSSKNGSGSGSGSGSRSGLGSSSAADPTDPVGISDASARGERTRASTRVGGGAREGAGGGGGGEGRAPGRRREMGQGVGLPRESAVEKTASGYSDLESVTDAETNGESMEEEAAAEDAREGSTAPSASFDARRAADSDGGSRIPRVGVRRRTRAHAFCRVRARARAHAFCRVRARAQAHAFCRVRALVCGHLVVLVAGKG